MKRWGYDYFTTTSVPYNELIIKVVERLNKLGSAGWEAISVLHHQEGTLDLWYATIYAKREIPAPPLAEPPAQPDDEQKNARWAECNCGCHSGQQISHRGTCCTPCEFCGKDIAGSMTAHLNEKHPEATDDLLVFESVQDDAPPAEQKSSDMRGDFSQQMLDDA